MSKQKKPAKYTDTLSIGGLSPNSYDPNHYRFLRQHTQFPAIELPEKSEVQAKWLWPVCLTIAGICLLVIAA